MLNVSSGHKQATESGDIICLQACVVLYSIKESDRVFNQCLWWIKAKTIPLKPNKTIMDAAWQAVVQTDVHRIQKTLIREEQHVYISFKWILTFNICDSYIFPVLWFILLPL